MSLCPLIREQNILYKVKYYKYLLNYKLINHNDVINNIWKIIVKSINA